MRNTFETVNKIRSILPELFEQGYCYHSVTVASLFTIVPSNRTIKITLKRVHEKKTRLKKSILKKLIKDTCMKTTFSYNIIVVLENESCGNVYYQTIKLGTQSKLYK